ncbi:MAG TPA: thiamine phosphate synthase [Burkholderiaceae bacterium]|nr:thiamine phosphate synthase [Burkholderiaceae bacterium]
MPALRWLRLPEILGLSRDGWRCAVLSAEELRVAQARPRGDWIGAFAERRADLERAATIDCDFALVGPVFDDPRWPARSALGWQGFAEVARCTPLPVYACGGISASDLDLARRHGAHGVAPSTPAA